MKKKIGLLALFCLIFCAAGLIGCGSKGEAEITGAQDIILRAEETAYDFSAGVTGTLNGEPAAVTVDSSKVRFGTPGEYDVVYSLGDSTVTVKARIYGMPIITAPNAIQRYSDAVQWTVGVTARDTFGTALQVTAEPPQLDVEGMPVYGESYTVTCMATDAAGNTATATRTITVSNQGRPTFGNAEVTLTAVDVPTEVPGDYITALNADQEVVKAFAQGADGKLYFNGDYFLEHRGTQKFTLVTTEGYNDFTVTVKDGDPMSGLIVGDIENFIFPAGEMIRFPEAKAAPGNAYRYEISYEVVDPDGSAVAADMFAPEEGNYTYLVKAKLPGSGNTVTISEQSFYVREETDVVDFAVSPQNLFFFSPNVVTGASIEFVEEVAIGAETSSAYRYSTNTVNAATLDRVLQVDQNKLSEMIRRGLTTVSFEIGTAGYENGCTWLNVEFFGEVPTPNGGATYSWGSIGGGMVQNGGWSTFTFDLAAGFTSPSQPTVYTQDASGNVIFTFQQFGLCFTAWEVYNVSYITGTQNVYIRNIRFGEQSEAGDAVNTYRSGDSTIELSEGGKAEVNGVSGYDYEIYGDGTVLFFNGSSRVFDFSMKYLPAGDGRVFSALNWNGTEYVGDFQFADGDLLTMSEGSVSFDLPDYASVFAAQPGFAYSLKKYGESVELASRPGQVQLTSAGAYEWTASFTADGGTQTYVYRFYVCAEDDLLSKVRMDAGGKISFIGMEEGEPVFRAESAAGGVILYLDGDLVESMIEENEELSLKLSVRNIGAQVHMMWDGGTTLTTPGYRVVLPGTPSWYEIGFDPCIFRTDGIERGEGKDLYLWFNGGNKLEFKGLSLTAAESETE